MPGAPPPEAGGVPFEDPSIPFFTRFAATILAAFRQPIRLFSSLTEGEIGAPLLYGHIVTTVGIAAGCAWQLALGQNLADLPAFDEEFLAMRESILRTTLYLSPLVALIVLFLGAGIFHLMLLLWGDGQRGFPVTFRAVCYGLTPLLLAVVPVCGGLIGDVWSVVLIILGAIHGHRTEGWRAVLAFFLPIVLCCCFIFLLVATANYLEGPLRGF
jgi:hypothetical protein